MHRGTLLASSAKAREVVQVLSRAEVRRSLTIFHPPSQYLSVRTRERKEGKSLEKARRASNEFSMGLVVCCLNGYIQWLPNQHGSSYQEFPPLSFQASLAYHLLLSKLSFGVFPPFALASPSSSSASPFLCATHVLWAFKESAPKSKVIPVSGVLLLCPTSQETHWAFTVLGPDSDLSYFGVNLN